jgi:hypothetical protein
MNPLSQLVHVALLVHVLQFGIVELHGAHTVFCVAVQGDTVNVTVPHIEQTVAVHRVIV